MRTPHGETAMTDGTSGVGAGTPASSSNADNDDATDSNDSVTTAESIASEPTTADHLSDDTTSRPATPGANNSLQAGDISESDSSESVASSSVASDDGNMAAAAAQGITALAAREGVGAARAREGYNAAVSSLEPTDRAGRTAAKAAARDATPPVTRAAIESARPSLGPREGSVASANRTNAGANTLARNLGYVGRGAAVAGVALGAARIATADNKVEEATRVAGGVLGGVVAGSVVGAQLGALGANPVTIALGAVAGAAVGGILGEAAVNRALDWARGWFS